MKIKNTAYNMRPLECVELCDLTQGLLSVCDGDGREYINTTVTDTYTFTVGGSLGTHRILLKDMDGAVLESTTFTVDCTTAIDDDTGCFKELLEMLYFSMVIDKENHFMRFEGKSYRMFFMWLRDHVHVLKGMKYFYGDIKDAIDFFQHTQRSDGMMYDNIYSSSPRATFMEQQLSRNNFFYKSTDQETELKRIPVENDLEYLFTEGLYYTWKATGDHAWMHDKLDSAIKAFEYSMTDSFRWSQQFQLLKRGFTIDTWDFQSDEDARINGMQKMCITEATRFGIMHGDNTGFARSCEYLAEMLHAAHRDTEADTYTAIAHSIREKLNALAWNGRFFTHHIPEQADVIRDFGVDLSEQVSLSNAYALNRNIKHTQSAAIIETYKNIKREKPKECPNEFFLIYPPFEDHVFSGIKQWQYMNGGTSPLVAGELAHGAFEHGFERYGVEILEQMHATAKKYKGFLPCCFTGKNEQTPKRTFQTISLTDVVNVDINGQGAEHVSGWTQDGDNDFAEMPVGTQVYHDIPFHIVNPEENSRKACIGLSTRQGYQQDIHIPIHQKLESLYLLHTASTTNKIAGTISFHYEDGHESALYIQSGTHLNNWWMPSVRNSFDNSSTDSFMGENHTPQSILAYAQLGASPQAKVAWNGKNAHCENLASYVCGINNPHPEKHVTHISFHAAIDDSFWAVFGITLSDRPYSFTASEVSAGIPSNWGAAAVVYALLEGLAGVKDLAVAYQKARIAPRWLLTANKKVQVCVKYEASRSYLAYIYQITDNTLSIEFTGNATDYKLEILMPENKTVHTAVLNEDAITMGITTVENSRYATYEIHQSGVHRITVHMTSRE